MLAGEIALVCGDTSHIIFVVRHRGRLQNCCSLGGGTGVAVVGGLNNVDGGLGRRFQVLI